MNKQKLSNSPVTKELNNDAIEKLSASIDRLSDNIGSMDNNSTFYAMIMERVTWILLFLAMLQIFLSFFPLLTYPWYLRLGMSIITGIGFLYISFSVINKKN